MSLARPGGVWRGNRKTTSSILRPVAPRDISKLRSSSSARLLAFRLGARRLGDLPGWLRPDPSRGSHSTPRDRRVRRTVARTRGETNPADPRRVVARARRLAAVSKTRLARSCAPRRGWRGWRWPLLGVRVGARRTRRRRETSPRGNPARVPAPSSRSASLFPSARAASLRRERAPTTRARSRAFPPRGSPLGGDVRATPARIPARPRAPRAPSRRARGGAMRPTRRRRGRRRGRPSGDAVPENREQPDDTSSNPRALALRTNPRARDQIQTPGREQTPFLLLSLRGGQPHPSLAARPPAARLGSAPRPIRDGDGSPRRIPKPKSARTADRERHRRRYHQRRGRDGARGGGYASRRTGDTIRGGEEGVRDGKGGVRRGVGGARRGRQRPTTREGRFARRGRGTSRGGSRTRSGRIRRVV